MQRERKKRSINVAFIKQANYAWNFITTFSQCNNNQCSVFRAILYYKEDTEVKHSSFIVLSECTTHDTTAVYLAQTYLMPEIQQKFPKMEKLYYVSDGAKQHFKN